MGRIKSFISPNINISVPDNGARLKDNYQSIISSVDDVDTVDVGEEINIDVTGKKLFVPNENGIFVPCPYSLDEKSYNYYYDRIFNSLKETGLYTDRDIDRLITGEISLADLAEEIYTDNSVYGKNRRKLLNDVSSIASFKNSNITTQEAYDAAISTIDDEIVSLEEHQKKLARQYNDFGKFVGILNRSNSMDDSLNMPFVLIGKDASGKLQYSYYDKADVSLFFDSNGKSFDVSDSNRDINDYQPGEYGVFSFKDLYEGTDLYNELCDIYGDEVPSFVHSDELGDFVGRINTAIEIFDTYIDDIEETNRKLIHTKNIVDGLNNGKSLDELLSLTVAWKYTNENGNECYAYSIDEAKQIGLDKCTELSYKDFYQDDSLCEKLIEYGSDWNPSENSYQKDWVDNLSYKIGLIEQYGEIELQNYKNQKQNLTSYWKRYQLIKDCTTMDDLESVVQQKNSEAKVWNDKIVSLKNDMVFSQIVSRFCGAMDSGLPVYVADGVGLKDNIACIKYIDSFGSVCYAFWDDGKINSLYYEEKYSQYGEIQFITYEDMLKQMGYYDTIMKLGFNEDGSINHDYLFSLSGIFNSRYDNTLKEFDDKKDLYRTSRNKLVGDRRSVEEIISYITNAFNYQEDAITCYMLRDNFAELSQYDSSVKELADNAIRMTPWNPKVDFKKLAVNLDREGEMSLIYALINGESGYDSYSYSFDDSDVKHYLDWFKVMSDDERRVFNYIYHAEGYEAAYQYLTSNLVFNTMDLRYCAYRTTIDSEFAKDHPIESTFSSLILAPIEGGNAFIHSVGSLITNDPIVRSDIYSSSKVYIDTITQELEKRHGHGAAMAYGIFTSSLRSLELTAVSLATGGVGTFTGLLESFVIMGLPIYQESLSNALDRGVPPREAVLYASMATINEAIGEHANVSALLSIGNFNKASNIVSRIAGNLTVEEQKFLAIVGSIGFQSIEEGNEEVVTGILNDLADRIINGDLSSIHLEYQKLLDEGKTEDEAWSIVLQNHKEQLSEEFLAGFISGGFLSGFTSISSKSISEIRNYIHRNVDAVLTENSVQRENLLYLKEEILNSIKGIRDPILIARKLYIELNKRFTYDSAYRNDRNNANNYEDVASFDSITNNKVICKSWAELFSEVLISSGVFSSEQVRIVSVGKGHSWVEINLGNGNIIVADATDVFDEVNNDLVNCKLGDRTAGFAYLRNTLSGTRLLSLFKNTNGLSINKYNEYWNVKDNDIGYARDGKYFSENLSKAKDLFFVDNNIDNKELINYVFAIPIPNDTSSTDAFAFYRNVIKNFGVKTLKFDSVLIHPQGRRMDRAIVVKTVDSSNNDTSIGFVYADSYGKMFFNNQEEYYNILNSLK